MILNNISSRGCLTTTIYCTGWTDFLVFISFQQLVKRKFPLILNQTSSFLIRYKSHWTFTSHNTKNSGFKCYLSNKKTIEYQGSKGKSCELYTLYLDRGLNSENFIRTFVSKTLIFTFSLRYFIKWKFTSIICHIGRICLISCHNSESVKKMTSLTSLLNFWKFSIAALLALTSKWSS